MPTAADDVFFDVNSGVGVTVTVATGAVCRSLDSNGFHATSVLAHNAAFTLPLGDATAGAGNRALRFGAHGYTLGNAASSALSFVSTSATQQTVDTNGKTVGNITFNGVGGSWSHVNAPVSTGTLTHTAGAWTANNQSVTALAWAAAGAAVRSVDMGTGNTWALTSTAAANVVNLNNNNLTLTGNASIVLVNASANTRTINVTNGGTLTIPATITSTVAGSTGTLAFGSNAAVTILGLAVSDATNARTVQLSSTTAFSLTVDGPFAVVGASGRLVTVRSSTGGTQSRLIRRGITQPDFVSFQDILATGLWYPSANSVNVSNNSGFRWPPVKFRGFLG